jgi:hypothetical protein
MWRAVAIVAIGACGFGPASSAGAGSDALVPDSPGDGPSDAAPPTGPWGTATVVFPGGVADDDPTLTADLLELYFNRNSDIYVTTRTAIGSPWSVPSLVTELSTASPETTPEITSDGLTIFLSRSDDIYVATRPNRATAWSTPVVVTELDSASIDAASAPTDDLLAIVLTSDRLTVYSDLFISTRATVAAVWSAPVPLAEVNSAYADFSPMLSQDRLTIYFDSGRNGVDEDLYMATRTTTALPFSTPTPITELDTPAAEDDPWVSPDGHHIVFERAGQLYEASR